MRSVPSIVCVINSGNFFHYSCLFIHFLVSEPYIFCFKRPSSYVSSSFLQLDTSSSLLSQYCVIFNASGDLCTDMSRSRPSFVDTQHCVIVIKSHGSSEIFNRDESFLHHKLRLQKAKIGLLCSIDMIG